MNCKHFAFILVLATALSLVPSSATAGAKPLIVEPPPNPSHRFFDAKNLGLMSVTALSFAADVISTDRALKIPGTRELNPLAQSQAALISLKFAGAGAGLGIAYMMHRSGHHRAERAIPIIFGLPSGIAAAHNFGIHR
jgi:hypothetical protein